MPVAGEAGRSRSDGLGVWKWLDSGEVEFRIHSISRTAQIPNPFVRLGFLVVEGHERRAFLDSARCRMRTFVELALQREASGRTVREAAAALTAQRLPSRERAPDELARNLNNGGGPN